MSSGLHKVQTALVSVSDKSGLPEFAAALAGFGVEILASGGTFAALKESGVSVKSLQDDMKLPTALSGRVKTLHAPLHASILARRTSDHLAELAAMGVKPMDMVVCNFYPFSETLRKEGRVDEKLVESIDIGGPAMVRAASKNFENVTVVPTPRLYGPVIEEMTANGGSTTLAFRRKLAVEAFSLTGSYDAAIFSGLRGSSQEFPERLVLSASKVNDAKYGENPDRKAVIYSIDGWTSMSEWRQLAGDTLSFNNYLDIGSAYDIVEGYDESAAVATVNHGQISGFAFAPAVSEAYSLAHSCD